MATYVPKEPSGKKKPVRPAEKNGIYYGTFEFTDPQYPGKTITAFYSKDTANGDFLQIFKYKFGLGFGDYTVPGRSDFKNLSRDGGPGQIAYYDAVGRLKEKLIKENTGNQAQALGGSTLEQIEQALSNANTKKVWDASKETRAVDPKATEAPKDAPSIPSSSAPSGGPVELPEVIDELQNTADATIKSLNPPGRPAPLTLQYPFEGSFGNTQDHVVIEQFTYRAPQENLLTTGNGQFQTSFADIVTGGLRRGSNLREYIGLVKLPIPNQLAISNAVSWGEDTANPVEAGAFFGALPAAQQLAQGKFGGAAGDIFQGFGKLLDSIKGGGFGSGTPAGLLLSSFIAQYMLGKVGINVDPAQFIARGTGTTINPNLELLFNGPKLRSFSLSFEFAPVDELDANASRRIIRFFRQGMAPKRVNTNTIFIGSPNVFRINYRTEGGDNIKGLHRHKICALVACETNFTPDGVYQSYPDPYAGAQPVRTTMTLSFVELTPIFENDYRDKQGEDSGLDDALGGSQEIEFYDIGF